MPTKSKRTKHLEYARIKRTEKDGDTQEKLRILEEWKEKQNCQSQWMSFTARPQLQKIIKQLGCPKCGQVGHLLISHRSMKGANTNFEIACICDFMITSWSAADNFNDSLLLATKLNGITKTQLERFLLANNFSVQGENTESSVTLSSNAIDKKIREINLKLIEFKENIEKLELEKLKAERDDVFVGSEDGAYPNGVRTRNSGACYSTVMGYNIQGEAKIVCK